MQPFVNPYLFSNPFLTGNSPLNIQPQPNMNSFQQPNTQLVGIPGRYVNDFSEITANDVPMNGCPAIFAKADRSEIQMREWSPNGQIVPTVYKLEVPEVTNEVSQPVFDAKTELLEPIMARLAEIEQKLSRVNKPAGKEKANEQLSRSSEQNKAE